MITKNNARSVEQEAISILESDSEEKEDQLDQLAAQNNITIYVTDTSGNALYNCEYIATTKMSTLPNEEFLRYYKEAQDNGGSTVIEFKGNHNKTFEKQNGDTESSTEAVSAPQPPQEDSSIPQPPEADGFVQNYGQDMAESIIYVDVLTSDNTACVLMVNTVLTPVSATVDTLRIQMIWITVVMIILSLLIALAISKKVSRSMIRVNNAAKKLAKGDFNVSFDGKDYLEIAELSETLNQAATDLGKNEKLQKELIANVSHDLRTPLTMIIAYSEVMRDLPGENTPENVQVVIDEAKRLTNLVNDMLDISKLQAGALEMKLSEFNLTDRIQKVLERYNKLKEQDGYRIDFEYQEEVYVCADEFKIFQVIYNLINNAINYTGSDKRVLVRQLVKEQIVRIEVIDSGEGISEENLPYVWDRYYKVDKTHKRAVMGTGLGLSIVKNILELHHAEYGVESILSAGSKFWFELPVIEKEEI
ncbi:MAG: HAMP domain-containing sensor histidine kinase [Roseburia porci]|nr:HAMP domain-containing histidine kinase [Roseburia sp.]MDD6742360.1 HAMP domain-containing sensor histidine kinase [Roseburia porci]